MLNSIDRRDDCGEKVLLDEKMMNVFVVVLMQFNAVVESGPSEVDKKPTVFFHTCCMVGREDDG